MKKNKSLVSRSRGMSLIELMIALTLMLIVLYAVTSLYASTKMTVNTQAGVSRMAENTQSAIDLLSRSLRQAAFVGCPSVGETSAGKQRIVRDSLDVTGAMPLVKIEEQFMARLFTSGAPDTPGQAVANSPIIEMVHAASGGAHLAVQMTDRNTKVFPMLLTADPGFQNSAAAPTSLGMISHCGIAGGEVFEVTAPATNTGTGWSLTTRSPLRARYDTDSRIYAMQRVQYFIQSVPSPINAANTTNALFMRTAQANGTGWNPPIPIVQDVDTLDIFADLDTDVARDYAADVNQDFRTIGTADYHRIVAFQIRFRMNTGENVRGTDGQKITREFRPWVTIRARAT
jgi:prepilin-type N-terminal cleavage/methylation domain-containing protein